MECNKIEELLSKKDQSLAVSNNKAILEQRNVFIARLRKDYDLFLESEERNVMEEEKVFLEIEEIVNDDVFGYVISNDKYREQIKMVFETEELCVGNSRLQLEKIKNNLLGIKASYISVYERFANSVIESLRRNESNVDAEIKKEIWDKHQRYLLSKEMFNELSNASLI